MSQYDPEPRSTNNLQQYVSNLTCKTCAGTGQLTSSVRLVTINGAAISPKEVTVRRCEACNGWGIQGAS